MRHGMILWLLLAAAPAAAQLLPGGLGQLPGQALGTVGGVAGPLGAPSLAGSVGGAQAALPQPSEPLGIANFATDTAIPDARSLLAARRDRQRDLIRGSGSALFADPQGNPARQGEILAVDIGDADVRALLAAGFAVLRETRGADGVRISVLQPPKGMSVKKALRKLAETAPGVAADYNHVYEPAGGSLRPLALAPASGSGGGGSTIGLIDGGVGAHVSLAGASIEQRGFAGGVAATGHGTAIASLLVGRAPDFVGAALGARLLVADIYGGTPANGSAESIAAGLDWLGRKGARIINVSLVGPANIVLARAIAALQARGVLIVAAVGNDGPAAQPMYPASYRGVIAVTGVDTRGKVLAEGGRATHVDFAAPGADMAAALRGGGFAAVRGTSFAAPLVAARLAMQPGDAFAGVAAEALPGGNRMGHGIVCGTCRNDPKLLVSKKSR